MPQSAHDRIAELNNLAAHAHTAAAVAHAKGDHFDAHELTRQAHEHSSKAHKASESLARIIRVVDNAGYVSLETGDLTI